VWQSSSLALICFHFNASAIAPACSLNTVYHLLVRFGEKAEMAIGAV
jgi:hypothetical protein